MKDAKPKFRDVVLNNDKKIYDLAVYNESKGYMSSSSDKKVLQKFTEFKRLILTGEFTLKQLEDDILAKYGVLEGTQYISAPYETLPQDIVKMIEETE